ncbi:MAG: S-adenosyl-l-methionine hydroxide adenosyltransferase family protein [candidate division KSB1 bacterium]|nr:S-adenosyl-l-methionine hydroxide adenosyltransferase family protein [candidate division KSB1 bacterium]MDZ7273886.1 S-adenosyl-l-methionine hydroxide adenosyltransferase family protein [candidate division KSB1 bacterium]MDZ7286042.1 S-adenosyl-l-methionine hydroxide adenosyltransferase family protein [candidate division KSB1 bacterium]MDZ7299074.1 S-adenosyl-l-methionine hydroxide adenosyltransferase family protein [candidate division KSB1 bacterium]MDZ7306377.1 S-adenosyl-l-methionine hydr
MMQPWYAFFLSAVVHAVCWAQPALVFQSDFGLRDGAVASMKGVAFRVHPKLAMFDLTHEIPAFNIWEAALRLQETAPHWPAGTVFVSVVDPGVGTDRKAVVLKTRTGHYFVTPDNGTLTFVAESMGIAALREIDENRHRLPGSRDSHTFHGRDVYAFTAARLAAGLISFEQVGPALPPHVVVIPHQKAVFEQGALLGTIPILDVQYGNLWTNIDQATFARLGVQPGERCRVAITHQDRPVFAGEMPYVRTFGEVPVGQPLLYLNSQLQVALAINQDSFAARHKIGSGPDWRIRIQKAQPAE